MEDTLIAICASIGVLFVTIISCASHIIGIAVVEGIGGALAFTGVGALILIIGIVGIYQQCKKMNTNVG